VAAGTLSASVVSTATNPLAIYKPNTTTVPGLGLYAPLRLAQGPRMISVFNNMTNVSVADISVGRLYTFTVEHDGGPDVYTSTHYLDNFITGHFTPRAPVSFYTNGGVFWVGSDPANLNDTLRGTMDEVIFDPPDGGRPPLFAQQQVLVFVPLSLR